MHADRTKLTRCRAVLIALIAMTSFAIGDTGPQLPGGVVDDAFLNSRFLLFGAGNLRNDTLRWATRNNRRDMVPAMIHAMRFLDPDGRAQLGGALRRLTGAQNGESWFKWMVWLEQHPEFEPFAGFDVYLTGLYGSLDPGFNAFIHPGVEHTIRLEEVVWGGGAKDAIPALTHPHLVDAAEAHYITDKEQVFGVALNGEARAYPYRVMDWHEMLNDVVGGVAISLAYCTLCGSGILFETTVAGRSEPFVFGSSGFLYRSNKLMYDRQTNSLWNQFTGRPVVGSLSKSDITLEVLPLVTTSWAAWKVVHPDTKVLSLDTGYDVDYTPGKPYGRYFASDQLMFPAATPDGRLAPKDEVFGLRITGVQKAWPLRAFRGGRVINDRVGVVRIVLIGDAEQRTVRAYRSDGETFRTDGALSDEVVAHNGGIWQITEQALLGPDGHALSRLPGHIAYWFAWSGFLPDAALYESPPNH